MANLVCDDAHLSDVTISMCPCSVRVDVVSVGITRRVFAA